MEINLCNRQGLLANSGIMCNNLRSKFGTARHVNFVNKDRLLFQYQPEMILFYLDFILLINNC